MCLLASKLSGLESSMGELSRLGASAFILDGINSSFSVILALFIYLAYTFS